MNRRGNGEGTAPRQRADGRWAVQVSDGPKRVTVYGKTAAEARRKAKEITKRVEAGAPAKDARVLLSTYIDTWIDTTLAASPRRPATKALYESLGRSLVKPGSPLADLRLDQLTPAAVEGWVAWSSETKAQSTVRSSYAVLRAVGDTAVRDGLLAASPAAKVDRPRVEHVEARFLNREEVAALRKALEGSRYAPIVDLLLRTGMRRGEALALHWA